MAATMKVDVPPTIESFFLADYTRLRDENEQLKAELDNLKVDGYGCFDLHQPTETVRVDIPSVRILADRDYGIEDAELESALQMDDDVLLGWASVEKGKSYYRCTPIMVTRHTYFYKLRIIEQKETRDVITDGGYDSTLFPLVTFDHEYPENNLSVDMPIIYEDELRACAIGVLRERIADALRKRKEQ